LQALLQSTLSRSIFTRDQRLFPMLMALEQLRCTKKMSKKELNLFIHGAETAETAETGTGKGAPCPVFVTNAAAWAAVQQLSMLPAYRGLSANLAKDVGGRWQDWMTSLRPETLPLPVQVRMIHVWWCSLSCSLCRLCQCDCLIV
jgi:hypothetical protein